MFYVSRNFLGLLDLFDFSRRAGLVLLSFFDAGRDSPGSLFSAFLISNETGDLITADVEFDFERGLLLLRRVGLDRCFFLPFPLFLALHVENF